MDSLDYVLSSYDYELDAQRIAQFPLEPRHEARLMIVGNEIEKTALSLKNKVWDLQNELKAGDLLVLNDTRVLKARLKVRLPIGSLAELLLIEPRGNGLWLCLGKPAKKMYIGQYLSLERAGQASINLKVISKDKASGGRIIQFPPAFSDYVLIEELLERYGEVPLPPYIKKQLSNDAERYQTRYASTPGAIAAPTAGLHLSDELLLKLHKKGVKQAMVTLHVGIGTFRPLKVDDLTHLKLHSEWVEVRDDVVKAIDLCHSSGGRVIAVGTTSVRALEAAFLHGQGKLKSMQQPVDLVIKPGFQFGVIDGLLTNFHLPKSSLLLLVSALVGRKRLLNLYSYAMKNNYRFFSYGDAMFISPDAVLNSARY